MLLGILDLCTEEVSVGQITKAVYDAQFSEENLNLCIFFRFLTHVTKSKELFTK